jgi:hypothetical protein
MAEENGIVLVLWVHWLMHARVGKLAGVRGPCSDVSDTAGVSKWKLAPFAPSGGLMREALLGELHHA